MSSRPQLSRHVVAQDKDLSTDFVSDVTIISKLSMCSYSMAWTGTSPAGSITIQVSDDYSLDSQGNVSNPGTWNDLILSGPTVVSGNTGVGYVDILQIGGYALRLSYTATSGTGTITVFFNGKVA